jgi:hypothetical protein
MPLLPTLLQTAEPDAGPDRCPRCGRQVERLRPSCPLCHEPLRRRGGPDVDVRRDYLSTVGLFVLLAAGGVCGVILTGIWAWAQPSTGGNGFAWAIWVFFAPMCAAFISAIVAAVIMTMRLTRQPEETTGGCGALSFFLFLALFVLAAYVFAYAVCHSPTPR